METPKYKHGTINWTDLTVPNAEEVRDFYKNVIGWTEQAIPMKDGDDEYNDFVMLHSEENAAGGICHSREPISAFRRSGFHTSVWTRSKKKTLAVENGGEILKEHLDKEGALYFVIVKDNSGAVFGMVRI